jgi:hypothetical protein
MNLFDIPYLLGGVAKACTDVNLIQHVLPKNRLCSEIELMGNNLMGSHVI